MPFRLSVTEIRHRLQTLRNYQHLHAEQKARIARLEAQVHQLREDNATLRQQNETLLIRLGELEEKIFGKKRDTDSGAGHSSSRPRGGQKKKQPRPAASYQRSVPTDPPTDTRTFSVTTCKHCGEQLTQITDGKVKVSG